MQQLETSDQKLTVPSDYTSNAGSVPYVLDIKWNVEFMNAPLGSISIGLLIFKICTCIENNTITGTSLIVALTKMARERDRHRTEQYSPYKPYD